MIVFIVLAIGAFFVIAFIAFIVLAVKYWNHDVMLARLMIASQLLFLLAVLFAICLRLDMRFHWSDPFL